MTKNNFSQSSWEPLTLLVSDLLIVDWKICAAWILEKIFSGYPLQRNFWEFIFSHWRQDRNPLVVRSQCWRRNFFLTHDLWSQNWKISLQPLSSTNETNVSFSFSLSFSIFQWEIDILQIISDLLQKYGHEDLLLPYLWPRMSWNISWANP